MSEHTPPDAAGALLDGRYELRSVVGSGSVADVWVARDHQLGRDVAVKLLHVRLASTPSATHRFAREARAAARLSHPNIVAVFDVGDADGRPYIVMEHVEGESLEELSRRGDLPVEQALDIVAEAARGLHHAHEHGLVHRDVKPANVLVSDDGQVKVGDFGVAHALSAETTAQTSSLVGTAAYVAPEQATGGPVDRRSDVYALGCVLYELLAGRRPFSGSTPLAVAYQHAHEPPTAPSELLGAGPGVYDGVVLRALSKQPDDRHPTAEAFADDLDAARRGAHDHTPTVALTPPPPLGDVPDDAPPPRRRSRRGGALKFTTAVMFSLLLLVGAPAAVLLWVDEYAEQASRTTVPQVQGMMESGAEDLLADHDLTPLVSEREYTRDHPEGVVLSSEPDSGVEVWEGDEVALVVSAGPEPTTVPRVEGLSPDDAAVALGDAGLEVGDLDEDEDDVDRAQVTDADPPPGEEVHVGDTVDLVAAVPWQPRAVPSLVALESDAAEEALAQACERDPCFTAEVERVADPEVTEGTVIEQHPAAGGELTPGDAVELLVSDGVGEWRVPDVTNQEEQQAVDRIVEACPAAHDCPDPEVVREPSAQVDAGRVITTDPEGGQSAAPGEQVRVVVADPPPPPADGDGEDDGDEDDDESAAGL